MNTLAPGRMANLSERRFFLWMSLAIAAPVVAGFTPPYVTGHARWSELPLQVAVHAIVMTLWIALFVTQCALVERGSIALHRRLGILGTVLIVVQVPLTLVVTVMSVQRGAVPPFFPANIFLVLNSIGALAVGGLLVAGITLRRQADWHRRLMTSGTIIIMATAWGRLLPMSALGPFGSFAITAAMLAYVAAGMAFDLAARRRIHRAWWVGAAVILAMQILVGPVAFSPPVRALAARLAGT